MGDNRFSNSASAPVGSSRANATAAPSATEDDDARLLSLEVQFNGLLTELAAALGASNGSVSYSDRQTQAQDGLSASVDANTDREAKTKQIEAILARLYPIELGIMQTSARTIAGLGVKARHAAYVMSQYWEAPVDQIDWDAQVARFLIEAVCRLANVQLPNCPTVADVQP